MWPWIKEDECEIVDKLIDLDKNLLKETISSLANTDGYTRKGTSEIDFINVLNWGGLSILSDSCA